MLRLRRYRLFLVVAVLCLGTLWHLTQVRDVGSASSITVGGLRNLGLKDRTSTSHIVVPTTTAPFIAAQDLPTSLPRSSSTPPPPPPPPVVYILESTSTSLRTASPKSAPSSSSLHAVQQTASEPAVPATADLDGTFEQQGQGRLEVTTPQKTTLPKVYWQKPEEHFPIPSVSLIPLPSGQPKKIPRIQHEFPDESSNSRIDRERKRTIIKNAFERCWEGYRTYAWGQDEIKPISGDFRSPFGGWGATLVDTLDTLWIMGLKAEFEEAVNAVRDIDFHTTIRKDIPLFETVIRYLGGLVAAYDVSNGRYRILLDKAQELAEVLMGAFDTPNRMPVTYYYWAPSYASQPHRAGTRVVLAELGSLSTEFTRLAQITKEAKYYDAIARITDELERWQDNTTLPGLWPVHIDASGCRKPERALPQMAHSSLNGPQEALPKIATAQESSKELMDVSALADVNSKAVEESQSSSLDKRVLADADLAGDEEPAVPAAPAAPAEANTVQTANSPLSKASPNIAITSSKDGVALKSSSSDTLDADCEEQGLTSVPYSGADTYSIAAMADSTYEYLPKEYMLLGGLNEQYRTMYEKSMKAVRKHLLYRPMTKDGRDILFPAELVVPSQPDQEDVNIKTTWEGTHLGCFAGGMFAVGAKIFDLESDMELAAKLADGCVWAYESTSTGIMPEKFELTPCSDQEYCPWNETKWWHDLDPYESYRVESAKNFNEQQQLVTDRLREEDKVKKAALDTPAPTSILFDDPHSNARSSVSEAHPSDHLLKRQVSRERITYESDENPPREQDTKAGIDAGEPTKTGKQKVSYVDEAAVGADGIAPLFTPKPIASHEDFVKARITEERLPNSFTRIQDYSYILRPEAIESVFIMYRITGDEKWRDKGWKMFQAVQTYTQTDHGNSAISDVTSSVPFHKDQMESFWLAETLKYYYLLFSDPSVISLDDYVLNTEAHPFRRPKPGL